MKESFARIVAWAKSHPLLAAVIVGAVVLVAYLVYKKNAASGAGASASAEPGAASAPDLSGLGAVSGTGAGGGGSLSDLGSYSGGGSSSGKVAKPIKLSGGSGFQAIDAMLPAFSGSLDSVYSGVDLAGATVADHQAQAVSGAANASGFNLRDAISSAPEISAVGSVGSGKGKVTTNKASSNKPTPAMAVGKGRLFTGTYNGVTYANGYPINAGTGSMIPSPAAQQTFIKSGGYGSAAATDLASIYAQQTGTVAVMHGH